MLNIGVAGRRFQNADQHVIAAHHRNRNFPSHSPGSALTFTTAFIVLCITEN
jgi:hypothetical protein